MSRFPEALVEQLTPNFSRHEFRCPGPNCCGNSAPINIALVRAVQEYRDAAKLPVRILSGFRCFRHNRAIGSKDTSQHPKGLAADIALFPGWTIEEMASLGEEIGLFNGIGLYGWGIHVDMRGGDPARWDYRNGKPQD